MDKAVSLTDTLLHDFKNTITTLTLVPSTGGVFEVLVNGKLVHSKKESNQFPNEETVVKAVTEMVGA